MSKKCWEVMKCPPDRKEKCPAFTQQKGEECWKVAGTLCRGQVQGTYAEKINFCRDCEYFTDAMRVKWSVKSKLLIAFAALLVLTAAIGALALRNIQAMNSSYAELIQTKATVVSDAQKIVIDFEKAALDLRAYLLTENPEYLERYNSEISALEDDMRLLEEKITTARGHELLNGIRESLSSFHEYAENALKLEEQGQREELFEYMKNNRGYIQGVIDSANELVEFDKQLLKEGIKANSALAGRVFFAVTLLILVAIGLGIAIALYTSTIITRPLKQLQQEAMQIAAGDLRREEIKVKSRDEVGILAEAFSQMTVALRDVVGKLTEKVTALSASAQELSAQAEQSAASASENSNNASEMAAAIEQVSQSIKEISENARNAASHAGEGKRGIERVRNQMQTIAHTARDVSSAIDGLNQRSQEVVRIIDLITQIADQTNLLALNAAIEAARAGEHGRGFAVVAEEVRKLAEQSASAARQIYDIINSVREESHRAVETMAVGSKEVESGTEIVQEVSASLKEILNGIENLSRQVQEIASSVEQLNSNVQNISAGVEEQSAATEEISAVAQSFSSMAAELQSVASRFKV